MFSITTSIFVGDLEDVKFFPFLHPVSSVGHALTELRNGYDVLLVEEGAWVDNARSILVGLGADRGWADEMIAHRVEYRRVMACPPPSLL